MTLENDFQNISLPRVSVRSMCMADCAIVFNKSFVNWKPNEIDTVAKCFENTSEKSYIDLVAERNNQVVGWLRTIRTSLRPDACGTQAGRALKQAWWMSPTDAWNSGAGLQPDPQGDILLGAGLEILASLAHSPAEYTHILAMMTEFGRHRLVRQLGLSRWTAQIPLADPTTWQHIYSTQAYVQQVEHGAIEDPILSQYLRQGARVLQVLDDQPNVWIAWENPVR